MTADYAVHLDDWLIERVSHYLERPVDSIDRDVDLAAYGMDSLYEMNVIADIEDHLDLDLDAATIREHPTINALIAFLKELLPTRDTS